MGAPIAVATETEVVETIVGGAADARGCWTITANLQHLRSYRREREARTLIDEADLLVADGKPLVWAGAIAGTPLPERVCGADLMWSLSAAAARQRVSLFLVGGKPGVADRVAAILSERYAELRIVGTSCPPLGFENDAAELARTVEEIADARPDLVLLALSFPKQDELIRRLRPVLPHASYIGIGAGFDFVSGELSRAPAWMGRLGLEWAHRLASEPRRLARRYLVEGIPFALQLLGGATAYRLRGARRSRDWGWTGPATGSARSSR